LTDTAALVGIESGTEKMTVEAATFDALRDAWDALLPAAITPLPFQSHGWAESWFRVFGGDAPPLLLAIRDEAGALIGIAPLVIVQTALGRTVQLMGGDDVTDYLDLVAAERDLRRVWRAVLDYLLRMRETWDAIDLHCVPHWSPSHAIVAELLSETMVVRIVQEEVCPVVRLGGSYDAYLRALPKKERHEVRRKARNFERDAPSGMLRILTAREEALAALPDFFRLHRLSAPDKERFLTPEVEAFFRGVTGAMADAGWLRLYLLDVDGAPVAAMFTFAADGRLLVYNSGFDPAHARISVGMVLTGMVIEDAAQSGLTLCDFLRGNEAYKYRFGASDTPIWRVIAADDGGSVDRAVAETEARFSLSADERDLTDDERTTEEHS
jgi:CelD/BcsL family acetyltransferase involved in cellulose biosynthesis